MEQKIKQMPKIELHCQLDGSMTLESVKHILGREVRPEEMQAGDRCENLAEYLEKGVVK